MKLTRSFSKISKLKHRNKVIQGSQGASKTYSILQRWIILAIKSDGKQHCSIVTNTFPNLRSGAIKDFESICKESGINYTGKKTPYVFNINNWTFEFFSVDKESKGLGGRRDRLFINEANRVTWKIARQLIARTHVECIFDFNPVQEFWAHTQFVNVKDCEFLKLTYKDNEHLPLAEIESIEKHSPTGIVPDDNYWRVYGLGELGFVEGTIFSNYGTYTDLPECKIRKAYGTDFGWQDPLTLIEVNYDKENNSLYWRELFYASQANYDDYECSLKNNSDYRKQPIICDTSPRDIMELRKRGLAAMSTDKRNGISSDIRRIKQCKLFIHKDSKNLIKETLKYKWQEQNSIFIDYPVDKFNHAIDAARYGSVYLLNIS